ncbi:hypothetical protein [Tardiphaga sp. 367_B4_N1_1]|uniref:hypothetical protein n=1 Tax=Tardiphaga sp. 367_B4_N1_1 TaxID=3240777 RepID=UPI003F1F9C1E
MPITEIRPAVINVLPRGKRGADGLGFAGTTATSLTIGTGTQAFETQPNLAYVAGARVRLISAADPTDYMEGNIASYVGEAMSVTVTRIGPTSSGTASDWSIVSAGDPGSGDLLSTLNLADLEDPAEARDNLGILPTYRIFNVAEGPYNAKGDYVWKGDVAMASGSTTAESAAGWVAGDVGKYIIVAGAGASGANLVTTIASYIDPTHVQLANANASGGAISGKVAEFGTDDTSAFQAAIDDCVAAGGGTVYIPPAKVFLVSRLDLANIGVSLTLQGEGVNSSRITPLSVPSYGTATGHVIDMTGGLFVKLKHFQLGAYNTLPTPTTGIFIARSDVNPSNRLWLENVYVSGKFSVAPVYNYGVPSSKAFGCDFYNYAPGAGQHVASIFTSSNMSALSSDFATIATGTWNTSDWSFFDCEWHRFSGAGADNSVCIWDGTSNINLFSGVVSGGATAYHFYYGACSHMFFAGVTNETESEPVVPLYAHYKVSGTVTDLGDPQSSYILSGGGGKFNGSPTTTPVVSVAF